MDDLMYEVRNGRRGSMTGCFDTYQLAQHIKGICSDLEEAEEIEWM